MPTASLRSVTASLALHAVLLATAAYDAATPPRRAPETVPSRLESTIAVEALGATGERVTPIGVTEAARDDTSAAVSPNVTPALPKRLRPSPPPASARARAPTLTAPAPPPATTPAPAGSTLPVAQTGDGKAPDDPQTAARSPSAAMSSSRGGPPAADVARPVASGDGMAGSGPASGAPEGHSSEGQARLLASYLNGARERVARHREYPYVARRANLEGTVCLRIVVASSGRVLGVTPTCGMAHEPLLEAALASVAKAAPFPPLPAALGSRLTFDMPVVFELERL
jgi:protein TonB